jgi:hypothetical protein
MLLTVTDMGACRSRREYDELSRTQGASRALPTMNLSWTSPGPPFNCPMYRCHPVPLEWTTGQVARYLGQELGVDTLQLIGVGLQLQNTERPLPGNLQMQDPCLDRLREGEVVLLVRV